MTSELIKISQATLTVLPADAQCRELIGRALDILALVPDEIDTDVEQTNAVAAQREAKSLLKSIEDGRKAAKAPYLRICKEIEASADALKAEISPELGRVDGALGDYQSRLLELARVAARQRAEAEAELERQKLAELEAVRLEAERIASEARAKADQEAVEARRKASEEQAAARSAQEREWATERAQRAAQQAEIRRLQMEADIARREQAALQNVHDLAKENALAVLPPVVVPAKADGQSVRDVWCHEVTDIHALYRANPGLVELTPRKREIGELLNRGVTSIPGIRAWKETRSTVRLGKEKDVVDV